MKRNTHLGLGAFMLITTVTCLDTAPTDYVPNIVSQWHAEITSKPLPRTHQRDLGFEQLNRLFARQQANSVTCGWYSANPTLPITCDAGYACAYWPSQTPGNFGCCSTSANGQFIQSACPYQSTCLNAGASANHNTGTAGTLNGNTLECGASLPACATILLNGPNGIRESHWFCTSSSAIWTAFQTTTTPSTIVNTVQTTIKSTISATIPTTITSAVTTAVTSAVTSAVTITAPNTSAIPVSTVNQTVTQTLSAASTQTGTLTTPVISSSPMSSGGGGGGSPITQADVSSKSSSSPPSSTTSIATATSTGSHMNVGAVAGGTVGGVAVLALVGAAIGVLVRRKKQQRVAPVREVSQMH